MINSKVQYRSLHVIHIIQYIITHGTGRDWTNWASSVLGCLLDSIEKVGERILAKLTYTSHHLQRIVEALSSSFSGRHRHPQCILTHCS